MSKKTKKKRPKKKASNKKALSGYKKVGSKFIAPMNQLLNMTGVSFYRRALPELIWWDVLNDQTTPEFACDVSRSIGEFFKENYSVAKVWGAFISDYDKLTDSVIENLKKFLHKKGLLEPLQESLDDFFRLYPKCPLKIILDKLPSEGIDISYLDRFEKRLQELEYKRSRAAILMQAHAVYIGFTCGKLHVFKDFKLGKLSALNDYPNTEESKEVGASICSTLNFLIYNMVPEFKDGTWAVDFWKRNYEFRPLRWEHLVYE